MSSIVDDTFNFYGVHMDYVKIAYNEALKSNFKQRVGAVIYKKGLIISKGFNKIKSHPMQKKYRRNDFSIYLHAEIDAITKCKTEDIHGASICVIRVMANGGYGISFPCSGCMKAITDYHMKSLIYFDGINIAQLSFNKKIL